MIAVERLGPADDAGIAGWCELRGLLWPEASRQEHETDGRPLLDEPENHAVFVVRDGAGQVLAFADISLRHDYVNGCEASPVAFLEGIYVLPHHRRQGLARSLIDAATAWAKTRGVRELASDAALANTPSHKLHAALGFTETERVVFFGKNWRIEGGAG